MIASDECGVEVRRRLAVTAQYHHRRTFGSCPAEWRLHPRPTRMSKDDDQARVDDSPVMQHEIITTRGSLAGTPATVKCPTRIITYAWGEKYVDTLLTLTLPALLAPGNLPYVASEVPC